MGWRTLLLFSSSSLCNKEWKGSKRECLPSVSYTSTVFLDSNCIFRNNWSNRTLYGMDSSEYIGLSFLHSIWEQSDNQAVSRIANGPSWCISSGNIAQEHPFDGE